MFTCEQQSLDSYIRTHYLIFALCCVFTCELCLISVSVANVAIVCTVSDKAALCIFVCICATCGPTYCVHIFVYLCNFFSLPIVHICVYLCNFLGLPIVPIWEKYVSNIFNTY